MASSQPIDMATFARVLKLDEGAESYDVAWKTVLAYFEHAETTFLQLDAAM